MRKRWLQYLLKTALFLAPLILIVSVLAKVFQKKTDTYNIDFFEQADDYDVLFLGTSYVRYDIYPMELWGDYGITSYNLGGFITMMPTSYWILMNVLDYAEPELVVLNVYGIDWDGKVSSEVSAHCAFDWMPLTKTKYRAVSDLFPDYEDRLEYFWTFYAYHSRWDELEEEDFHYSVKPLKGAEYAPVVTPGVNRACAPKEQTIECDTIGMEYFRKIIEECQSRDIDVMLIYLPCMSPEDKQLAANAVYEIAEEYGIAYLNFEQMGDVVDYETDLRDYAEEGSHLNAAGARKVTDYLGRYMQEHYRIADHRADEAYAAWHEDYAAYMVYKDEMFRSTTMLDRYLMLGTDKEYDCNVTESAGKETVTVTISRKETGEIVDEAVFSGNERVTE